MSFIARLGENALTSWGRLTYVSGVAWSVVSLSTRPRYWPRTVRNVLSRQILFTGIEATSFISLLAVAVGVSIVVQAQLWLGKFGQAELLGPILVMVVVREVGPLLVNFVVIGRSGTAIATELGNMKVSGELRVLDAQGLDPFTYLVIPRVLGIAISVFCLTIIFITVTLITGFVVGLLFGANIGGPGQYVDSIMQAFQPADVMNVLIKTLVPGLLTGAICCTEGLSIKGAVTEVPQATTRSVVRSVTALFIVSALVSLLTYL